MSTRGGSFAVSTPMLWVIGCIVVLGSSALTSFVIAEAYKGRVFQDTYFVAAHAHWAFMLAAVFGFFAGWYYLFPKISGFACSDLLGKVHFWLSFIGFNTMLVPQVVILAGTAGRAGDAPDAFRLWNLMSSIGAYVFAAGTLVFFANMALSFLRRRPAG